MFWPVTSICGAIVWTANGFLGSPTTTGDNWICGLSALFFATVATVTLARRFHRP